MRRGALLLGSVAGAGCVIHSNPSSEPSRLIASVAIRPGVSSVAEDSPDGPTGPGLGIGTVASVSYRVTPRLALGLGLDFTLTDHPTMDEARDADYAWVFLPVPTARVDLGRFAVTSWAGYYVGFRSLSLGQGSFGTRTYSSVKSRGVAAAAAGLVRFTPANMPSLELGPYVQLARMVSHEDDPRTQPFVEHGLASTAIVAGAMIQVAFGAPRVPPDRAR